jgi:NADH-quinone oxidoreductase subunit J
VALALFVIVAIFTLGGAVGVVATRNVVHAALFLLLSLLGAAGAYLLLFAEFLALVQVLIYGGAVTIVVLFAVMLTRSSEYPRITDNRQWPLGLITAIVLAVILGAAFWLAPDVVAEPQAPEFKELGASLFTKWALPFEIASLVLLVALIGAIIIARTQNVVAQSDTSMEGEG